MRSAVMSVLRGAYPLYRPILSRFGMLGTIVRKYRSDKPLHGYVPYYSHHFRPW